MYARASYITAVGVVELPYLIAQTLVFVPISYFMIGKLPYLVAQTLVFVPICYLMTGEHPGFPRCWASLHGAVLAT